jgi:hypothetical protein
MKFETWKLIADELFFIRQAYNSQKLTESEKIAAMREHVKKLAILVEVEG